MASKRKTSRRTRRPQKQKWTKSIVRLVTIFCLLTLLAVSVCLAGYVIFFRTVVAQEIMPGLRSALIFEEPDQLDIVPAEEHKIIPAVDELLPVRELPKVAIIIDDMGYHEKLGQQLLHFPYEITYSFLPYAPYTKRLAKQAHQLDKTILLHLPLQPRSSQWDPGPGTLYIDDAKNVLEKKFEECFSEVPNAVGVNNHMGSLFTETELPMITLMSRLKYHSLFFIDSYTTPNSLGRQVARKNGVKSAGRHVFLDNSLEKQAICRQFDKLVEGAEVRGWGIGIGHPRRQTIEAILSCSKKYTNRIEFVSIKKVLL